METTEPRYTCSCGQVTAITYAKKNLVRKFGAQYWTCTCGTRYLLDVFLGDPYPVGLTPDLVNHPPHYTSSPAKCDCGKPIECIQVTEHMNFCLGNAVKYIWRSGHKGSTIEDLKKARYYISREIDRLEGNGHA